MIIDLINAAIKADKIKEEENHKVKHNFSPTDVGKCPRQLYYEFKGLEKEDHTDDELRRFATGNLIHEYLQRIMPNQLASEFRIEASDWHGLPLSGYVDSIVLTPRGLRVIDFKTVKAGGLNYAPKEDHIEQVMLYLDALGLKNGVIIYWDKSSGDLKECEVKYDSKVIKKVVDKFKLVHKAVLDSRAPNATINSSWICDYCKYKKYCEVEV